MIFCIVKKGIMEWLEEWLGAFREKIVVGKIGVQTLSFREFMACIARKFFRKDPIAGRRWIANMENAQLTSFYHE